MTAPSKPLIADRQDTTRGWAGIWIAEDIQQIVERYRSGNWIDQSIGGFAAFMDALAFVTDPLGTLVSWGVSWLLEHVQPLREPLDRLAGDRTDNRVRPDVVLVVKDGRVIRFHAFI
jgi:hypothetical protein